MSKSHRSRRPKAQLHVHCESCYSRRCRARVEVSVSCALVPCRLLCGAAFHLCKEEDHLLLCPNVRVPCLNAGYGCPVSLTRSGRAAHLQACPASVVCCSMEWLRWPIDDTDPHDDADLRENVLKADEGRGEALDLAMALVDQRDLFARLKMKPLYPELMEEEEEESDAGSGENCIGGEAAEIGAGQRSGADVGPKQYNLCDMMFSMERGGCAAAQANQDNPKQKTRAADGGKGSGEEERRDGDQTEAGGAAAESFPPQDTGKTGLAPWQDGVLERLGQELTPQEFNMYLVHHGRMLLTFGQIAACTPREKDFVYGSLEPIPVQTLHSFKVPDSYRHKRRVQMYDTQARVLSEARSVDTSDLPVQEEDWHSDEAAATLLGYAELEVMGHKISGTKGTDGLYVDVGTQTHSFRTAPFKRRTTLAEVAADTPPKLRLQLQAERVSSRNNKANSAFTFLCGHAFHRREFPAHFRNVHNDIQTSLSGWFEQRCPLAYLGCTYSQRRFQPSTHKATITYNQELRSFNLRPVNPTSLGEGSPPPGSSTEPPTAAHQRKRPGRGGGGGDSLSALPYEVLCHVASFLDSLSLSQLALVSRLMREVCCSLLQERGMVSLRWEKKTYSHGGAKWKAKPVWEFSHLFSSVDSWHFADIPPISVHLKACPYYKTSLSSEPVLLPSMSEQQGCSQERQSLVAQFMSNYSQVEAECGSPLTLLGRKQPPFLRKTLL
ncbi:F-box only protein 40 [Polymixia lowei]